MIDYHIRQFFRKNNHDLYPKKRNMNLFVYKIKCFEKQQHRNNYKLLIINKRE